MLELGQKTIKYQVCSYFYSAYLEKGILANSGHNCKHPEQEEIIREEGQDIGNCYSWSCPLCHKGILQENKTLIKDNIKEQEMSAFGY